MSITFSAQDVNLPHIDTMVITVHIDRWDVIKILIDNGSQAEIFFHTAFEKMGYDWKQLTKPLYGFCGKIIEPIGVITLPVSFSTPQNHRTEYITFDVVDMLYPYNAIFGRGLLNTFEAALHSGYLCLKIPATFHVISVFGTQQDARNIEKGFVPSHKNVHFLREELEQHNTSAGYLKAEAPTEYKKAIKVEGEFKKVPLDPRVPDRIMCIGMEAGNKNNRSC
jgi:hypothetical protein